MFSSGELYLSLVAVDYVASAKKLGVAPPFVKTAVPTDGSPGGAAYFAIPKAASPAQKAKAAKFINCALSDEFQVKMTTETFEYPATNVWSKIPKEIFDSVPNEAEMKSSRFLMSDEASQYIQKTWQSEVGY